MCGLVGVAGDIRDKEKKMFRDMLVMDQVRGFDSTGVFIVPAYEGKTNQPELIKDVGPAQYLWEYDTDNKFDYRGLWKQLPKVMIGHNRAATVGKIIPANAHPFARGSITGAHNGSLRTWKEFDPKDNFATDSEAVFDKIDQKGIDWVWKNLNGAAALTYWDDKAQQLNIIRNGERPLYIHWSADGKTMFWASEYWMIFGAALRNGVKLAVDKDKTTPMFSEVKTNHLHTYNPKATDCETVEVRELEKKTWPTTQVGFKTFGGNNTAKTVFQGNEYKKDTKKTKLNPKNLLITELRRFIGVNGVNKPDVEYFKGTLVTIEGIERTFKGAINIYPTNITEREYLSSVLRHKGVLTLEAPPRQYLKNIAVPTFAINSTSLQEKEEKGKVVQLSTKIFHGPDGNLVDEDIFKDDLKQAGSACAYCMETLYVDDHRGFEWIDRNTCICPECVKNWGNQIPQLGHYLKGAIH